MTAAAPATTGVVSIRVFEDAMRSHGRHAWIEERRPGATVRDYLPPMVDPERTVVITDRGKLRSDEWDSYEPRDGESLTFAQWPAGIGALIATSVFALAEGGFAATATAFVIDTAILIAVSYGVNSITSRSIGQPENQGLLDKAKQNTYTFNGIETTALAGNPIPVILGTHPVGGNVLWLSTAQPAISQQSPFSVNNQALAIVLCLGEGEIYGFPLNAVRINGNIVNDTNFPGFGADNRKGTPAQLPLTLGLNDTRNRIDAGNAELRNPNTGPTNDPPPSDYWQEVETINACDRVYVNILHPRGLFRVNSSNQYRPLDVHYQVRYRRTDEPGNWLGPGALVDGMSNPLPDSTLAWGGVGGTNVVRIEATHPFEFATTEVFEMPDRDQYTIQVRRWTRDSRVATSTDEIRLDSIEEGIDDQYSYPGLALYGFRAPGSDLIKGGLPTVSVIVHGAKNERWDPDAEEWVENDHELGEHNNPSWLILMILRNTRWGLGSWVDQDALMTFIDEWVAFADFCDELVDDGDGGTEKRATFDGVFEGNESPWEAILRIAKVARATIIPYGEAFKPKWEYPRQPTVPFTMGNIRRGTFRQQWLDIGSRPTRYQVRFLNRDLDYQIDAVAVEDPEALALGLPEITETIDMFGITRSSHALREAKFWLNYSKMAGRIVEWEADIDSLPCEPGDVVLMSHDVPQWGLASGRLRGATSTNVQLDRQVVLETGVTYEVLVRSGPDVLQTRLVTSSSGTYAAGDSLNVESAWDETPAEFDVYAFGRQNMVTQALEIIEIRTSTDFVRQITAIHYNPAVHDDAIDQYTTTSVSELPDPAAIPPCLVDPPELSERLEAAPGGGWISNVDVSWVYPDPATTPVGGARVYYRNVAADFQDPDDVGGPFVFAGFVPFPTASFSLVNLVPGDAYDVSVILTSTDGNSHKPATACTASSITIQNAGLIPAAPPNFSGTRIANPRLLRLKWEPVPQAVSYEVRRGEEWAGSTLVGTTPHPVTTLDTERWAPTNGGPNLEHFFVRGINAQGLYGEHTRLALVLGNWFGAAAVEVERDETALSWPGTKTNVQVASDGRLELVSTASPGTYETADIDLGSTLSNIRIGAVLWAAIEGGPDIWQQSYTWQTANQLTWSGPVAPYNWPYELTLEVKYADTVGNLSGASWMALETTDLMGVGALQLRLTLAAGSAYEPRVRDLLFTVESF